MDAWRTRGAQVESGPVGVGEVSTGVKLEVSSRCPESERQERREGGRAEGEPISSLHCPAKKNPGEGIFVCC